MLTRQGVIVSIRTLSRGFRIPDTPPQGLHKVKEEMFGLPIGIREEPDIPNPIRYDMAAGFLSAPWEEGPEEAEEPEESEESEGSGEPETAEDSAAPGEGENREEEDAPEETELLTEGMLVSTSTQVEVRYSETEQSGMLGTTTKISFDRENPGLVSLTRRGEVTTVMIFEAGKRHMCLYSTPFGSLNICVQTLAVQNRIAEEGSLYLDYLLEIHGLRTEYCRMWLQVRDKKRPLI